MRDKDKSKDELLRELGDIRQKYQRLEYEIARQKFDQSRHSINEKEKRNRLEREESSIKEKREREEQQLREKREREERERLAEIEKKELERQARLQKEEMELKSVRDYAAWVVYATPTILCGLAPDGKIRFLNPACETITGYKAHELLGNNWWQLLYPKEDFKQVENLFRAFKNGDVREYEMTLVTKGGKRCTVSYSSINRYEHGSLKEVVLVGIDVSARKRIEGELESSEEKFRTLISNIPCAVCRYAHDDKRTVIHMSNYIQNISGYSSWDLIENRTLSYSDIIHHEDRPVVDRLIHEALARKQPYILEYRIRNSDGDLRWVHEKGQGCFDKDGSLMWLDSAIFDITDRKAMEKKMEEMLEKVKSLSLTDELTKLYNRRGFITHADQQLKISVRNQTPISILFIDLDDMKGINDNLGHQYGDQALIETAKILRKTFRDSDIVARLGGDEFAVLAIETNTDRASRMKERLLEGVKEYNQRPGVAFKLGMSVGVAGYSSQDPCSIEKLLERADKKMYEVKRSNKAA